MRTNTLRALGTLALLLPAAVAWTAFNGALTLQPQSRLWVEGTSTVRSFECTATLVADVQTSRDGAVAAVLGGEKAVTTVVVTVPAEELDCRNGTMNNHMFKALKSKEHPTIEFRLESYDLAPAGAGISGTLRGHLSLGGVTRPVTIEAAAADGGNGTLVVTGRHRLRMTEFGLKPPTLMLGTMRVGDNVDVGFELFLTN
ncbi:MAG TPA: YceI family protein [Gemmatimonadaceae bacterium]|nr:YceI family protein [Gemmatimonadaceae bacterium]